MAEAKNVDHCGDCRFWLTNEEDAIGKCRRYPPSTVSAAGHPSWVVTRHDDWCGEFANPEPPPERLAEGQSAKNPEKSHAKAKQ